ncbi:BF3164 family lipoprotein [Bacteroides sp. 224]|uniref:BF3164 family lipoprotein n=1 Tax=Bacteroides sp. 224 TaxID=2302936 RepID=UPI0013D135BE|nr:BF3164 family lipoprotein [Bacteroides sp. 224]NDV65518.1 hypothetical protein [Bacteroides sp. 224]
MWKSTIILITSIFILVSCKPQKDEYNPPVFPISEKLSSQAISEELIIGTPYDMFVHGDYIFILAFTEEHWLQAYDKHTGDFVGKFARKGQGPNELIMGTNLTFNSETHILSIYDSQLKKVFYYRIGNEPSDLVSFIRTENLYELGGERVVRNAWPLYTSGNYLIDGQLGEGEGVKSKLKRFQMLSQNGIVSEYNQFPISAEDKYLPHLQTCISVSPNQEKMAVGILNGAILEMFDLKENISLTKVRKFYPPSFDEVDGRVKFGEDMVFGFAFLCSTDTYIYTILIGDKDSNKLNNISVFDWEGNEVCRYETDCPLLRLYSPVDEPDKLYGIAVSDNQEFYLVSFDLKL